MRTGEALYKEESLGSPHLSTDQLIEAIHKHPILLERPIVITPKGARICRPAELINEIL